VGCSWLLAISETTAVGLLLFVCLGGAMANQDSADASSPEGRLYPAFHTLPARPPLSSGHRAGRQVRPPRSGGAAKAARGGVRPGKGSRQTCAPIRHFLFSSQECPLEPRIQPSACLCGRDRRCGTSGRVTYARPDPDWNRVGERDRAHTPGGGGPSSGSTHSPGRPQIHSHPTDVCPLLFRRNRG